MLKFLYASAPCRLLAPSILSHTGRLPQLTAGSISSDFNALHDYRGRPRSVSSQRGVVAADHGRCSDIGKQGVEGSNTGTVEGASQCLGVAAAAAG